LKEVKGFDDLKKFPLFEDEWLRGGPIRRWVPQAFADKPIFVFETGGTTGIPKSRMVIEDHRIDYEKFSDTLPDKYFPRGANWLMLGPSGPADCDSQSNTCASIVAGSASVSTSIPAGSSS
jgi:hypothetical protein